MARAVLQPFEDYQKARITFVQTVAELSTRPQNIEALHSAGVIALLRPLLLDLVPSIQQSAALAIGRLANHSQELAESVVGNGIITQLIDSVSTQNRFFKKAVCYVLKAVSKHSPELAENVVKRGALEPLIKCLEEFDPTVKECAAWAIGYIAKHNAALALHVVEARAIDSLILCLAEPELALKRAAAQTLSYICQHTEQLAHPVAESGLDTIAYYLNYKDSMLKRNICMLLGNISKHSIELANQVMLKISNPQKLLACLKDEDNIVRRNAAFCICEISKKTQENCQSFISAGGASAIVDFIANTRGENRLYGLFSLGIMASFKEELAMNIIKSRAIKYIKDALENEPQQHLKSAACYALGQLGRHSPLHANEVAEANVLTIMLYHYNSVDSSEDLRDKAKKALKNVIDQCQNLAALEPLLQVAPQKILSHIINQYVKHLKENLNEKRLFVQNGGLQKLQELKTKCDDSIKEKIEYINGLYPPEIVRYYSPEYAAMLLKSIEEG